MIWADFYLRFRTCTSKAGEHFSSPQDSCVVTSREELWQRMSEGGMSLHIYLDHKSLSSWSNPTSLYILKLSLFLPKERMSSARIKLSNKFLVREIKTPLKAFQHLTQNPSGLVAIFIYRLFMPVSTSSFINTASIYNSVASGGVRYFNFSLYFMVLSSIHTSV